MDWSRFDDSRRVAVVGFRYHQPALRDVARGHISISTDRCEVLASLVPEPTNAHDSNAVQVMVDGQRIGYLKAGSAKRYRKRILNGSASASYPCLIRRQDEGWLQAHLQIPYGSELLEGYKNPKAKR